VPGTAALPGRSGRRQLLDGVDLADIHGQFKFNFVHPAISRDESKIFLDRAFPRDFERNGPSLFRLMQSMFVGWQRYRHDPDARIRARVRPRPATHHRLRRGAVGDGALSARLEPGRR